MKEMQHQAGLTITVTYCSFSCIQCWRRGLINDITSCLSPHLNRHHCGMVSESFISIVLPVLQLSNGVGPLLQL